MKFDYSKYEQIPKLTSEYMKTVGDVKDIHQINLNDINDFLNGLEEANLFFNQNEKKT
jgi:hypothetical protein